MPAPQSDLLQGTLDVLILKSVALQELHGMGISRRIAQMTNGTFDVMAMFVPDSRVDRQDPG